MPFLPLADSANVKEATAGGKVSDHDTIVLEGAVDDMSEQLTLAANEAAVIRAERQKELQQTLTKRKTRRCKKLCHFRFPMWFNYVTIVLCLLTIATLLYFSSTYIVKFALEGQEVA
jgi:hypothetical protein